MDLGALAARLIARQARLGAPQRRDVLVERDVEITMDDGVALLADIYTPPAAGPHPTVLVRTPYGRRGFFGVLFGRVFAERGFRSVVQSCRGTFGSGGEFRPFEADRDDGLATARWIEAQVWFDGRLALVGPSYLGYVQWAIADELGDALRALCPIVTTAEIPVHWYAHGSFNLDDAIGWTMMLATQERPAWLQLAELATQRIDRRIHRVIDHLPVSDLDLRVLGRRDARWRTVVDRANNPSAWDESVHTERVAAVRAPVHMMGGWYDLFLPAQLADYARLADAGKPPHLTIGPWTHVDTELNLGAIRESLTWFRAHVLEDGTAPRANPVRLFVMGAKEWREYATWPPAGYEAQAWHLDARGVLSIDAPVAVAPSRYTYDPADPTPIRGSTFLARGRGGSKDQRDVEARSDVLCFTSAALTDDVEVIGAVDATVHIACDIEHVDVCVRLCDVDERGRSTNVTDGLTRLTVEPGAITPVRVELWPTAHRFMRGHRIRVHVASGAFPRWARNLGTGEPIATGTRMQRANVEVHHDPDHPSAVVLPTAPRAQADTNPGR